MKLKNIKEKLLLQYRVMEYLAFIVIFLVPIYYDNSNLLFSFSSPKTIVIICIVILMSTFYLWGIIKDKKISFRITPLHIVLVIFLIIITVSSIWGIDPYNSFFGRWTESISLVLIYFLSVFTFFIANLIKKDKPFLLKILLVSFISSIIAIFFSYTNISLLKEVVNKGSTIIGNDSYFGAYLLFNVCFGVGLFFYYQKYWQKILLFFGIIIIAFSPVFFNKDILIGKIGLANIIHSPFLTFGTANAAIAGLGFSFLIMLTFFLIFSIKKIFKILGVVSLLFILIITFYMGLQLVKPNTFINNTYIEAKGNNRLVTWDIAKVSFISHPFLGSGFNNFSYDYQKYFSHEILKEENPEFYFNQPHNVIWEYASNNGVLGLLSFFSLLIFTFLALFIGKEDDYKKERSIKIALIGALFGYFVQNFFGFDTPVTYLMLFFLIGIAMGLSNKEWVINVSEKYKNLLKIKAGILIAICLIGVVIFIILPIKEFREWGNLVSSKNSKERISIRENVQKISLFGGIVDSVNGADKFYDFFTKNLSSDVRENKKLYEDEIQSILKQLEEGIKKQPNEIQAYIKYSQFLSLEIFMKGEMNDVLWNKSYDSIKKALTINPRNPEIYLLLAQTYILKEDFKNVYFAIHKALEIGPKYKKSYDYANKILKIKPDADFQKFINEMMIKNDIKL